MDLPRRVYWLALAVTLALLVFGAFIAIWTAPPGNEACGPQPVTEGSDLKREAHGCKRQ